MSEIIIGKHTLESLTSGMYADPYVVFREYIQNSTDAIDSAYKEGVLKLDEDRIDITLIPAERKIIIEDNGIGIHSAQVEKTLVSIGNSNKSSENERGFRGIGRLSGLSYCSKLIFETSYPNEPIETKIVFDAKMLSNLLLSDSKTDVSVVDVLQKVYTIKKSVSSPDAHFFRVVMEGVSELSGLNEFDGVYDYLSQNVPVPYSPDFSWGKDIVEKIKNDYIINEYHLFLSFGLQTVPVYKPYKNGFLVDKGKNLYDRITDISIIKTHRSSGELTSIGWLATTNYLGSIYDKAIKGIRVRKGNILIGDSQTLNVVFKDARFNGWSIGELFVIDPQLVPNARRDNFEKNPAFFSFQEQLMTIASTITKDIRSTSIKRNSGQNEKAKSKNDNNSNSLFIFQQGTGQAKIQNPLGYVEGITFSSQYDNQTVGFDKLDMLIGKTQGVTEYKAINVSTVLSKAEKKVLEQVFNVISTTVDSDTGERLLSQILSSFENKNNPI